MLSLYDAVVPTQLQMLGAVSGLLDKAAAWIEANGKTDEDVVGARLAPDMLDFAYQVKSTMVHSVKGIEGVQNGHFSPDTNDAPRTIAGLKALVADAIAKLEAVDPATLSNLDGKVVEFRFGDKVVGRFAADQFLLTFSQPQFFFHVTTVYALLRMLGVEIGKRDFMGATRRLES